MIFKIENEKLFDIFKYKLKGVGIVSCWSHKNDGKELKRTIIVGVGGSPATNSLQPCDYKFFKPLFNKRNTIYCVEINNGMEIPCEIHFIPSVLAYKPIVEEMMK